MEHNDAGMPSLTLRGAIEHRIESRPGGLVLSTGDYPAFCMVMKGGVKADLQHGKRRRTARLSYGSLFLIPEGCECKVTAADQMPCRVVTIPFEYECRVNDAADTAQMNPSRLFMTRDSSLRLQAFRMPMVLNWINDMQGEQWRLDPSSYYAAQSHLYAIAAEYMKLKREPAAEDDLIGYVAQVRQDMLESGSEMPDIDEIARMSGVGTAKFYRAFKQQTGLSPHKFLTVAKLGESLKLLSGAGATVMGAASTVGYSDPLYFSRLFKKHIGISPTEYASCAKLRIANLCPVFRGDLTVLGVAPVIELPRGWSDESSWRQAVRLVEESQPELILTYPIAAEISTEFQRIAPVMEITWKGYPWRQRLFDISTQIGIRTVAEHWLTSYERKLENARFHIRRQWGERPWLVASAHEPFYRVYGMERIKMSDLFYGELGIRPPDSVRGAAFIDTPDIAELARLDCDHILFLVPQSLPEEECVQIEEQWMELRRTRQTGLCLFLRYEDPLLYNPMFYERMVDRLVGMLTIELG
jgi:AraC-like DNA-binding protein